MGAKKKPHQHRLAELFYYPLFLGFACTSAVAASRRAMAEELGLLSTRLARLAILADVVLLLAMMGQGVSETMPQG
jgi:hypothetical protein